MSEFMSGEDSEIKKFKIPHVNLAYQHDQETKNVQSLGIPMMEKQSSAITSNPVTYTWENVTVDSTVVEGSVFKRNKKTYQKRILNQVSGAVRPGEFLAIMGASGAGKTTLLNCLTFRNAGTLKITGDRFLNGAPVNRDVLARISGYVQQDDLFIGTLKVGEVLRFQALLRMDKHFTNDERMERVEQVIQELGLSKCRNTLIGNPERGIKGISGGERKRLAFACEVLTNPSLMFCDEPTSGLDSFMAQNVVQALKNIASSGKTVICTIHQPSSEVFSMFDRILLMANGKTAFLGPIDEALGFFASQGMPCPVNFNPADFFIFSLATVPGLESQSNQKIDSLCDSYSKSEAGKKVADIIETWHRPDASTEVSMKSLGEHKKSPYKTNWFRQFTAVLWRSFISVLRDPQILFVKGASSIFIALLVALLYQGQELSPSSTLNIQGVIFLFITNATFENVFAVINTFSFELPIFLREHFNGMYRTDVYFLSKTLAELFVYILFPFIGFAIPYYAIGLNPEVERFFIGAGIIILVANTATSFGYMISCLASSPQVALGISAPLIIPMLLFGGFFLQSGTVPVYLDWIKYLSWFLYGNEALSINQWHDVTFNSSYCNFLEKIDTFTTPSVTMEQSFSDARIDLSGIPDIIRGLLMDIKDNIICTGEDILDRYNFESEYFIRDIACLGALIIGFRLLAFLALLSKTYRK